MLGPVCTASMVPDWAVQDMQQRQNFNSNS